MITPTQPQTVIRSVAVITTLLLSFLVLLSSCTFKSTKSGDYSGSDGRSTLPNCPSGLECDFGLLTLVDNDPAVLNIAIEMAKSSSSSGYCENGCVIDIREQSEIRLNSSTTGFEKIDGLSNPMWIVGDGASNTALDGDDKQHFHVDASGSGFFALQSMKIRNGKVSGSNSDGGAGAGLGGGGAIFINDGSVVADNVYFRYNEAEGGSPNGNAGKGGNANGNKGAAGHKGAGANGSARYSLSNGGNGGSGGDTCPDSHSGVCDASSTQDGKSGGFGSGGGSAGGGGSDQDGSNQGDRARDGGSGGYGGFGAGGGGGGGGGADDVESPGEVGDGGYGGSGGPFAIYGSSGSGGESSSNNVGGSGGSGGKGAGLGGAVFVREGNGGSFKFFNGVLEDSQISTKSVTGCNDKTTPSSGNNAIFVLHSWASGTQDCNATLVNDGETDYNDSGIPEVSLSIVGLNGESRTAFFEGQRAQLKVEINGGSIPSGEQLHFYLSDNKAYADYGYGSISNDQNTDFGWNNSRLMSLTFDESATGTYFVSVVDGELIKSSEPMLYSGIPLYLDEELEGKETFDISLLASPFYKLPSDLSDATVQVEIRDANYRVSLDSSKARAEICEAADALESAQGDPIDCSDGSVASEIDVSALKGLGYVTVVAQRPTNVKRSSKSAAIQDSEWVGQSGKSSSLVLGSLFNNALAGGLPVHYTLNGDSSGVLSNQINYNNSSYKDVSGELLGEDGAQVFHGVVIPAINVDINALDPDNPPDIDSLGEAKIYFAALPDAIKESDQTFSLELTTVEDPSYNEDNFCTSDFVDASYCENLFNTPEGTYQYYVLSQNNAETSVSMTIKDAGEFVPAILVIDDINGELVTNADNPLLRNADGEVSLWVRLGSQPTSTVTVDIEGTDLDFTADNWFTFHRVTVDATSDVNMSSSSSDAHYDGSVNRTLTVVDSVEHFKVREGEQTDVSSRKVFVGVQSNIQKYYEGQKEAPSFKLFYGQPLPFDTKVILSVKCTNVSMGNCDAVEEEEREVTVPAWHQQYDVSIPVKNNEVTDPYRFLLVAIQEVRATDGSVIENIVADESLRDSTLDIVDDESANVVLSQHLPATPTPNDIARLMPKVNILGVKPDGSLQVQHDDNRITGLSIVPVEDDGSLTGDVNTETYGLFKEFIDNSPVEIDGDEGTKTTDAGYDYIQTKRRAYKSTINASAQPLNVNSHPQQQIIRQSGYLTVDADGFYKFVASDVSSSSAYELWINSADDYSQNKALALPYFDNATPSQLENTSQAYELKKGQRYYIETLFEAPQSSAGDALVIHYQMSPTEDGNYSVATDIPLQWLEPNAIGAGFYVDTYEDIAELTLEDFVKSDDYKSNNATHNEFYTNTLALHSFDASEHVGRKIKATIVAPETGDYQFALAADGDANLWIYDAADSKHKIAWIDGKERPGTATFRQQGGDFSTTPYSRVEVTITRDDTDTKDWSLFYQMAENSIGTGPFGPPQYMNVYADLNQDSSLNADTANCVTNIGFSSHLLEQPAELTNAETSYQNFISVTPKEGCLSPTNNADGTETLKFVFWDFAGETQEADYTALQIDQQDVLSADYPPEYDWYWSMTEEEAAEIDDPNFDASQGQLDSNQRSASIPMIKGETYVIEIAQVNIKQEDHFSVAWKLPSSDIFEVMDTDHIAFTERTLPVSIVEASNCLSTSSCASDLNNNGDVTLALKAGTFEYAGKAYKVSSVTLAGEPIVDGAVPYASPGWLEFASGFAATVKYETEIKESSIDVQLTAQDRPSESSTVNLTVGQQQRIGIQLASQPPAAVTVSLELSSVNEATLGEEQIDAQINLYCQQGSGSACDEITFTPNNWQLPQYVTVFAVQEGVNQQGKYDPQLSVVEISANPSGSEFNTDIIKVNVFPDSSKTDVTYFALATQSQIDGVGFKQADVSSIEVINLDNESDLGWDWQLDGTTLVAKSGAEIILYIRAMTFEQEGAIASGIPVGTDPVDLTANLLLTPEFYKDSTLNNASIAIENIALYLSYAGGEQPSVGTELDITIDNGQPYLQLRSVQTGAINAATDITSFTYAPVTNSAAESISAKVGETIVTEYGELSIVPEDGDWKWIFASNPRPQIDTIPFSYAAHDVDVSTNAQADLTSFQSNAYLATSLAALPDYQTPRIVLTANSNAVNEGESVSFIATLQNPDGSLATAANDLNVYYKAASLGITEPGNSALITKDDTEQRAIELSSAVMLLNDDQRAFTIEAWLQPTSISSDMDILGGKIQVSSDNNDATILAINNGKLVTSLGSEVALPTNLNIDNGFHVAWVFAASAGQFGNDRAQESLFINGKKVYSNKYFTQIHSMRVTGIGKGIDSYFNGSLDEIRIWDVARTDAQIAQIYNAALADVDDDTLNLTGYWSFNNGDINNQGSKETTASLFKDGSDTPIDITDQSEQAKIWLVRQAATDTADYTGLSEELALQQQLLALSPEQTQSRTTFALADLNQDTLIDVVVANRKGDISVHLSEPSTAATAKGFASRYRAIDTNLNVEHAAPMLLTELDGEQVLLAGLPNGKLAAVRGFGQSIFSQLSESHSTQRLTLTGVETLDVAHPRLAMALKQFNARAANGEKAARQNKLTFAPAKYGEHIVLATNVGVLPFTLRKAGDRIALDPIEKAELSNITISKPLQNRKLFPQFVDLDNDGDQDLIVDSLYNLAGQTSGVLTYYQNYGSDEQPLFIPAPRSRVADMLAYFDNYLAPSMRKRGQKHHPYDQVAYRQITDMNGDGRADMVISDNYGNINLFELPNYFAVIPAGNSSVEIPTDIVKDDEDEITEEITLQLVEGSPKQATYHFVKGQDRATVLINDQNQPGLVITSRSAVKNRDSSIIDIDEQDIEKNRLFTGKLFEIALNSRPTEQVTVRLASSDPVLGGVLEPFDGVSSNPSPSMVKPQIVFEFSPTDDDWSTPKSFWVAGTIDDVDDPEQPFIVLAASASADPNYAGQTAVIKAKSSANNDEAKLNFDFATLPVLDDAGAIVSSEGQINAVTVSLNAKPTKPLSVTLQPEDTQLTLFPQRKLVRALNVNKTLQQISRKSSRSTATAECALPSGNQGIPALGKFGAWCWAQNGEYRYEQARFDAESADLEQLSFVIDNSYGNLSTDTLSVMLTSAPDIKLAEQVLVYDRNTEELLSANTDELLLADTHIEAGSPIATVSFALRPATNPGRDKQVSMTIGGADVTEPLIFTEHNWRVWQSVVVEESLAQTTVTVDAVLEDLPEGASVDEGTRSAVAYGSSRTLTVVKQASPRLIIQDWRSSQPVMDIADSDGNSNWIYATKRELAGEHMPVVMRVRLSTAPASTTTVSASDGTEISFTPDDYDQWKILGADAGTNATITISADAGGYTSRTLNVQEIDLASRQGNFFDQLGDLAGEKLTLHFTPENWTLGQTIAVAAIDDLKVEYNTTSDIRVSYSDVNEVINGDFSRISWYESGKIQVDLNNIDDAGDYVEKRLWLTDDDAMFDNHSLDIVITAVEEDDESLTVTVNGYIDAPNCVRDSAECRSATTAVVFTDKDHGRFINTLNLPSGSTKLTGVDLAPLAAEFLATPVAPLSVNIQDNDMPIVRADVDLHASENTHPGYFTLSVRQPVGVPGGLAVHYKIYGAEDSEALGSSVGATAETTAPAEAEAGNELADPGPDFQGYDTLKEGTAYIPEGKTRVSLPIFPIDDFTPEESLAARYEKVVLQLQEPAITDDFSGDNYRLDTRNTAYQSAGVKILDNEEVGLKFVLPLDGVMVNEAGFNAFKVGLKSQPQAEVAIDFYNTIVRQNNQFDGTYLQAESVTFDNTDWNQWKVVNVFAFDNQQENQDKRAPRFSDLFYTVLDKSDGSQGDLNCQSDPTEVDQCEPFYNTMKGALNLTGESNDTESETIEIEDIEFTPDESYTTNGAHEAVSAFGTITATSLKDTSYYAGDFVYRLHTGEYDTSNSKQAILKAIASAEGNVLVDHFNYSLDPLEGSDIDQQVAVYIQALERTTLDNTIDPSSFALIGKFGELTVTKVNENYEYAYAFDESAIEASIEEMTGENMSGASYQVTDPFVYQLTSTVGTDEITEYLTLNVMIRKYTAEEDGSTQYYAAVNGNSPEKFTDGTIVSMNGDEGAIHGILISDGIEANTGTGSISYDITAAGRPEILPVVTKMSIRNSSGEEIWVGNNMLTANPMFETNAVNGADRLLNTGEILYGKYGQFTAQENGDISYVVNTASFATDLAETDLRIVSEDFVLVLSTNRELPITITTVLQNFQGKQQMFVTANGDALAENGLEYTGNVVNEYLEQTVLRAGKLTHSVRVRDAALDPVAIADGLRESMMFVQQRFYDTSVPVYGRFGGGPTTDTSGRSADSNTPAFIDRFISIMESQILSQPHLTTEELTSLLNVALQSVFAQYNIPLQVLKVDTEKMLLKLSYTAGVSSATDEYKTDWGMAGMGHFSGSTAGTFKYTIDLVFGVKFRTVVDESGASVLRNRIFVVTDEATLAKLMGEPQIEPVTLYNLKTWEGANIGQTGVQFVNAQGKRLDNKSDVIEATNTKAINDALEPEDFLNGMHPYIKWRWKDEPSDKYWGTDEDGRKTTQDFGTLIGYLSNTDDPLATDEIEYGEFIAITLRQPESIGPNKDTLIQMSVVLDPTNLLKSNKSADKLGKEAIYTVLEYLSSNNVNLIFDKQKLKVFDTYAEQTDPKQDQKSVHESQELTVKWEVAIEEEYSSDPIGMHLPTYSAKLKITDADINLETEVDENAIVLPVDSMIADSRTVQTVCRQGTSSEFKCKTDEELQIEAVWKQGGASTKRFFPTDKNAFKSKTTYSEVIQMGHGKLKLMGKVSGGKVTWTWEFSSLPAKSLDFGNENILEVPVIKIQPEASGSSAQTEADYVITKHMLMFLEKQDDVDTAKMNAISKMTVDMAGSMEFRGDMQLWVIGATVNQATRSPSNVEDGMLVRPEEIFDNLVGSSSAKQTIKDVEDRQDANGDPIPNYIVGQYGVLSMLPSGHYAYAFKPELTMADWTLSCDNLDEPITDAIDAAFKAQCELLFSEDEDENLIFWPDRITAQPAIYAKGYQFDCASYNDLIAGNGTCEVSSPNVVFTPEDRDQLTKDGVPSLESAINYMGTDITGWEDSANLGNRKSLKDLYEQMQTGGTPEALNGITELVDEFYVSVSSDTSFRLLSIRLGEQGSIESTFNNIPASGPVSGSVEYTADTDVTVKAWPGAKLNYHEPGIGDPLQMSSMSINAMAEANVFVDVALKAPAQRTDETADGLLYLSDITSKPKDIVQFTIGGNASMYAHINGGFFAPPSENGDDTDNYQSFSLPGPSVAANIGLAAQFTGTRDFSDVSNRGAEFVFGAYNLEMDLGEFISDKLVEPLGHLNNALEPIQPVANALTADMKIFSAINLEHVFDANEDGKVTILEVPTPFLEKGGPKAQKYEKQLMTVNRFLEFIASISDMIRIADELGDELAAVQSLQEQVISTDGYQVSPDSIRIVPSQSGSDLNDVSSQLVPYVNQLGHVVLGTDTNYQYIKTLDGTVGPSTVREMKPVQPAPAKNGASKNASMNKVKSRYNDLQKRGIISFPILSNPADVLKFVFGDPADLILIDVPDFLFEFEVQKGWRPPPVPIFLGKISGGFEMGTDTVLGVDTGGLLQTICGSDSPTAVWNCQGELSDGDRAIRLLNSVFVRDWSDQSYYAGGDTGANKDFWRGNQRELPGYTVWDKHELAGNAEIDIGAGIDIGVFGAMFQGGPGIGGGIDLVDLCESTTPDACETIENGDFTAGGYYDGKIRAYDFAMQMVDDTMSSFDMAFTFYVDFEAYIHTFHIKVWEELIGYFPLFVFDLEGAHWAGGAKSKSGAPLAGATLYFDANNNNQYDAGEPMTFTNAKGYGSLYLPFALYDRNLNGRIDDEDGTIRHFGGVNIKTGLGEIEQMSIH